jgi:beta-glucosidase/6-phospho-beta-glucosidase/beta-galactosidase
MAKEMGINWTRLHDAGGSYIGWDFVETEKGKWNFRDTKIQRFRRNNIKILGGLSTTPKWARTMKESHDGYADRWSQPTDMADYANYVKTITQRYKGVIDHYEVWNEPWLSKLFWHTHFDNGFKAGPAPQRDYARLMQAAYSAAKDVDPNVTIVGINTTTHEAEPGFIDATQWTRGVTENRGLGSVRCHFLSPLHGRSCGLSG